MTGVCQDVDVTVVAGWSQGCGVGLVDHPVDAEMEPGKSGKMGFLKRPMIGGTLLLVPGWAYVCVWNKQDRLI